MTNLTDKQRAALVALRDVMKEHDIKIEAYTVNLGTIYIQVFFNSREILKTFWEFDISDINELLEQETE